jgi:hypothetical protein
MNARAGVMAVDDTDGLGDLKAETNNNETQEIT